MSVYAFTELHNDYPAFVNLSEQPDGALKLSVRTRGNGGKDYASIALTDTQAEELAEAIFKHVYAADAPDTPVAKFHTEVDSDGNWDWKVAAHLPAAPAPIELAPDSERIVDYMMEAISCFASEWSLVGGKFDQGDILEQSAKTKQRIRRMLEDDARKLAALAARQAPTKALTADELKFNATRLRRVVELCGLESAAPETDADLVGCMGSVLGMVAREIESRAARQAPTEAARAESKLTPEKRAAIHAKVLATIGDFEPMIGPSFALEPTDKQLYDIAKNHMYDIGGSKAVNYLPFARELLASVAARQVGAPDTVRDAARYQWLRRTDTPVAVMIDHVDNGLALEAMDEAIDAAIAQETPHAKG